MLKNFRNLFSENKVALPGPHLLKEPGKKIEKPGFGDHFVWGVATSAYQTEGGFEQDGKGLSIWDTFTNHPKFAKYPQNGNIATDFYNRFQDDIILLKSLNFKAFRMSVSWPRVLPEGYGMLNQKGVDFYNRVIDNCLDNGITPWLTLYHWDLPQALEDKGGWTNREIITHFEEYVRRCSKLFGDRVKNWIVLNEPMSFTGLGYFAGYHAPGKKGINHFLAATHHAALCQAIGARAIRENYPEANVGTSVSVSWVKPLNRKAIHINAARRLDALLNRLFVEPLLGMGYPFDAIPELRKIEKFFKPGDEKLMAFDMDFLGLQYYFRTVAQYSLLTPLVRANEVPALKRDVPVNAMNLEIYPKGFYKILQQFSHYPNLPKLIVTESGICLLDKKEDGIILDADRIAYHKQMLRQLKKAAKKNIAVDGYFVWTFIDNFEWSGGVSPRFGIVYNDFETQERTIKESGKWVRDFLG